MQPKILCTCVQALGARPAGGPAQRRRLAPAARSQQQQEQPDGTQQRTEASSLQRPSRPSAQRQQGGSAGSRQQRAGEPQQAGAGSPWRPSLPPKQLQQQQEGRQRTATSAGRPPSPRAASGRVFVPVAELQAQGSCAGVWAMLEGVPPDRVPVQALSAALSRMVKLGKAPGQELPPADLAAVRQLLGLALRRLGGMNGWTLTAFIRFAAAFKAQVPLDPAGLRDWRTAMGRRGGIQGLNAQNVSNSLLSLGTLADENAALAAVVDRQLAAELLRRAAEVVGGSRDEAVTGGSNSKKAAQDVANALYGAALLGLQPSAAEAGALFEGVGRHAHEMASEALTQASWLAGGRGVGLKTGYQLQTLNKGLCKIVGSATLLP